MEIMGKSITLASPEDHFAMAEEVLAAVQINVISSEYCSSCVEVNLKGTKNTWDYPNKTFEGKKYQLRKVAFIAKYNRLPVYDVSHRCGNGRCINLDHVADEPNNINQSRKCCKLFLGNPLTPTYTCPHELMRLGKCIPANSPQVV